MDERFLPGRISRESEFVRGLTGACGPNAAAMAERWADQSRLETLEVFDRMRAAGRCDPSGASTLAALADDARAAGYHVDVLPYHEPMPVSDWRGFFDRHAGHEAIVMETANGQVLRDYLSGLGENARNLHYHFIMVAGWHPGGHSTRANRDLPSGWWCADGDNFVAGDVLEFYPDGVLAAARPCAAMAVYARVQFPPTGGNGGDSMGIPTGWKDDGKTLTAPNGHVVVLGFRDYVLAHNWPADDVPLESEHGVESLEWQTPGAGGGSRQVFARSALRWSTGAGVGEIALGPELLAVEARLAAVKQQLANLQQQLATGEPAALDAVKALGVALAAVDAAPK